MTENFGRSLVVAVHQDNFAQKKHVREALHHAGLKAQCKNISAVYRLEGHCNVEEARQVARKLLSDPVVESFSVDNKPGEAGSYFADVWYKPGVTDAVGDSVLRAIKTLEVGSIERAFSGTRYEFKLPGKAGAEKKIKQFVDSQLLNPLIQECKISKR